MSQSSENIASLVARSVAGERDAFRLLYEEMLGKIYTYIRSRVHTDDQATDITQDVFVGLWSSLPRFTYHSKEQFYAYVFVITKRALAKFYAEKKRTPLTLDAETVPDTSLVSNHETADSVDRALAMLDSETKNVIVLHHWSGYTFGEIAKLLNMNESAVRVRHHRGIKTLRIYFKENNHE